MKAYVMTAETIIKDDSSSAEYRKAVPDTVEAFGGKFIARGGDVSCLRCLGCFRVCLPRGTAAACAERHFEDFVLRNGDYAVCLADGRGHPRSQSMRMRA